MTPAATDEEPEQEALFQLEGPDEDSCVWIAFNGQGGGGVFNLGPREKVAEKFAEWLAEIDFGQ